MTVMQSPLIPLYKRGLVKDRLCPNCKERIYAFPTSVGV